MNSNFYVVDFYSLAQFTRLNFFKALTPGSTSISISLDPRFPSLFFFSMFSYEFLKNEHEMRLKYTLMGFVFIQSYLSSEECALTSNFVTKFNFLHQNIYAHVLQLITPQ